jgi:outer membrane protein assembly factor BamD (BamD/ComL family)
MQRKPLNSARPGLLAAAILACLCGCASPKPSEYARLDAGAARAYSAGRYDEAARQWEEAARAAKLPGNKSAARYMEASSLLRGGRRTEAVAVFDRVLAEDPKGPRAARAAYDRALTLISLGQTKGGYDALDAMLRAYPESGVAPGALRRYLTFLGASDEAAVRRYLERVAPSLEATELGEHAHYAYAASLERDGPLGAARARYAFVAQKYPYPRGALWDDALFHAADLDARLGEPRAAIARLEGMLERRETAYMSGSYERGRYAEARYRIAELYRDALADPNNARRNFEKLFSDHTTSRLRDDAAWNAALLALRAGDRAGACKDLDALVTAIPDSRFAPCAPRLCPELKARESKRGCPDYVARSISERP